MSHIRHCLKCYKLEFNNIQTAGSRIEDQASSIDQENALTNQIAIMQILNKADQLVKYLGFQSRFTWYIR